MIIKLIDNLNSCSRNGKKIFSIAIIRKEGQKILLKEIGADIVINSEGENFHKELKEAISKYTPKLFLDAVGGELAGKIINIMPDDSCCIQYGGLSHKPLCISTANLVFRGQIVKGFWLKKYIDDVNDVHLDVKKSEIYKKKQVFSSKIQKIFKIEECAEALNCYRSNLGEGKILFEF